MKKYAVIVAAGVGSRMGGGIPKQFRNLCGHPVLWWSMKAFHDEDPLTGIVLVIHKDFISLWNDFFATLPEHDRFPHQVTAGGETRSESVANGLKLTEDDSLVAVHDGARPLVSADLIARGWKEASNSGAAVPVIPVTDSLREIEGSSNRAVDRSRFVAVQTPQVFKTGLLKKAYVKAKGETFTDDASVAENDGVKISLFEGSPDNIKITTPKDMAIASLLLANDA